MQRRATGLLVVVAAAFVALAALTDGSAGWVGYALAALEGSLVGGLADWFAVTALFRRPLGLPIPHTGVIRDRKDQFAITLGQFVQENFLAPAVIVDRIEHARPGARLAAWLGRRENAEVVARYAAELAVGLSDVLRDDDVQRLVHEQVRHAVTGLPIAPLAGAAVRLATADGRHQQLLDSVLREAQGFLGENREELRQRFGQESPWWLPNAVEDRIFDRLLDGAAVLLQVIVDDPEHEVRRRFDQRVVEFAARLESDPALAARAEQLKQDVLAHPELRAWTAGWYADAKAALRSAAADPGSRLRSGLASTVVAAGARLAVDSSLQGKVDRAAVTAGRYVAEHHREELGALISSTIARWDADETAGKLELLLGRDLQFIRINGTVVGGLAGLLIHALSVPLGVG